MLLPRVAGQTGVQGGYSSWQAPSYRCTGKGKPRASAAFPRLCGTHMRSLSHTHTITHAHAHNSGSHSHSHMCSHRTHRGSQPAHAHSPTCPHSYAVHTLTQPEPLKWQRSHFPSIGGFKTGSLSREGWRGWGERCVRGPGAQAAFKREASRVPIPFTATRLRPGSRVEPGPASPGCSSCRPFSWPGQSPRSNHTSPSARGFLWGEREMPSVFLSSDMSPLFFRNHLFQETSD